MCAMSMSAKQVMETFLKEIVIPKVQQVECKQEFKSLSREFIAEADLCARKEGIKGEERDSIGNAFIERSLGILYDIHKVVLKISSAVSSDDREAIRETIIFNGRSKKTANKSLLANAYIDLYLPVDQKANPNQQEKSTLLTVSPLRHKNTLPSERPHAIEPCRDGTADTPLVNENRQLESIIQSLEYKLSAIKMEKSTIQLALDAAKKELQAAERDVLAARAAQQVAENRLNDQANALAQTLSLLGDATATISELKSKKKAQ